MEALLSLEKETTELLRAGGAAVFSCAEHRQCLPDSRGLFVVPLGTEDSLFLLSFRIANLFGYIAKVCFFLPVQGV